MTGHGYFLELVHSEGGYFLTTGHGYFHELGHLDCGYFQKLALDSWDPTKEKKEKKL